MKLIREYIAQAYEGGAKRSPLDRTQAPHEALLLERAHLIKGLEPPRTTLADRRKTPSRVDFSTRTRISDASASHCFSLDSSQFQPGIVTRTVASFRLVMGQLWVAGLDSLKDFGLYLHLFDSLGGDADS